MTKTKTNNKILWRNMLKTSTLLRELVNTFDYLVFFDTETTGLKTDKDRIIQLSAIKTDKELNEIDRFDSYANPYPLLISPKITEITGIKMSDVANAPLEKEMIIEFNKFSTNCCFIAYNSEFDADMLKNAFLRAGINRNIKHFDVREMAYDSVPNSSDFKLATVCDFIGLKKDGSFHNSMYDVEMMLDFFKVFYNQYLLFEDNEKNKPKVKVFALNPWSIGKNRRIYVPTSCGSFYYDIIKKHWGEKDASFDDANMCDVEEQAIKMANIKGYDNLSKVKESIFYRDL